MELNRAKEIISVLAEGIDPTTGEVLPYESVCNKGEVVRAFYTILASFDTPKAKKKPLKMPESLGRTKNCTQNTV
jgi:hypothetical protein